MPHFVTIIWDDFEDDDGNVAHIAEHGFDPEDLEYVLRHPVSEGVSKSTGRPCVFGTTLDGDFIIVIYEQIDADTIYPVTAYEVDAPS